MKHCYRQHSSWHLSRRCSMSLQCTHNFLLCQSTAESASCTSGSSSSIANIRISNNYTISTVYMIQKINRMHYSYIIRKKHPFDGIFSRTIRVSGTRKAKPFQILMRKETIPTPHHSIFMDQMLYNNIIAIIY